MLSCFSNSSATDETPDEEQKIETENNKVIKLEDVIEMEINMDYGKSNRVLNLSLDGEEPDAVLKIGFDQDFQQMVEQMKPKKLIVSDISAFEGLSSHWLKKISYLEIRLANDEKKIMREMRSFRCNKLHIDSLVPLKIDTFLDYMESVQIFSILGCEANTPVAKLSNTTLKYLNFVSWEGKGIKILKLDNLPGTPIYIPELIQFLMSAKFQRNDVLDNDDPIRIKILNVSGKRADLETELKKLNLLNNWSMQTRFKSYEIQTPKSMLKLTVFQCSIDDEGYDNFRKNFIDI